MGGNHYHTYHGGVNQQILPESTLLGALKSQKKNSRQMYQTTAVPMQQQSDFLNRLTNLEQKSKCYHHLCLNEFYCLACHREICSHCVLMPTSAHYGHQHVQTKAHLAQMGHLNHENVRLCDALRQKLSKGKEEKGAIVDDRLKDLGNVLDARFDHTVAKLRSLQSEIKKRYEDVINANLD